MKKPQNKKRKTDSAIKVAMIGAFATVAVAVVTGIFNIIQKSPDVSPASTNMPPTSTPLPAQTPAPLLRTSIFDAGTTEGWVMLAGEIISVSNGYLSVNLLNDSVTSYFIAPPYFHGDWREYSEIRFDLMSRGGEYYTSGFNFHGDIYLASNRMEAEWNFDHRPSDKWESFSISLHEDDNWVLKGGAVKLVDVLANITDFQIRAEYGGGADTSGLDNVILVK